MDNEPAPLRTSALSGLKVVEFADYVGGSVAGTLLADMGAEVVHVEDPKVGDVGRTAGAARPDGKFVWWSVMARNKRSVTIDLSVAQGVAVARALVEWADVVITNRPDDELTAAGLTWSAVHSFNPKAIMLQVTTGGVDHRTSAAGKVAEAASGVVTITGFPDQAPVYTGFAHAEGLTGLMGAYAVLAAENRRAEDPDFDGEYIELGSHETLFRLIEWQVVAYDQLGVVPMRAGNQLAFSPAAVINTYRTADEEWLVVTSATYKSVLNVVRLLGEPIEDYAELSQQSERRGRLDSLLRDWIAQRTADEALETMAKIEVVASRVFTIEDIVADETYREKDDIVEVVDELLGPVRMQTVIPQLDSHPGSIWRTGPSLGADNELVLRDWLGLAENEYSDLVERGVL